MLYVILLTLSESLQRRFDAVFPFLKFEIIQRGKKWLRNNVIKCYLRVSFNNNNVAVAIRKRFRRCNVPVLYLFDCRRSRVFTLLPLLQAVSSLPRENTCASCVSPRTFLWEAKSCRWRCILTQDSRCSP